MQRAGAEVGKAHRLVRDGADHDAVEGAVHVAPEAGEAFQHQLCVLGPGRDAIGASADRTRPKILAQRLHGGRAHDHARAVGQYRGKRRKGRVVAKLERAGTGDHHRVDRPEVGAPQAADRRVEEPVQARLGSGGIKRRTVMESQALAQRQAPDQRVGLLDRGEPRLDRAVRARDQQRFVHVVDRLVLEERGGKSRVERDGVRHHANGEGARGLRAQVGCGERADGDEKRLAALEFQHDLSPSAVWIKAVTQTVAQQVEAKDGDEDRKSGKPGQPVGDPQETHRVAQHVAPGRCRRLHAEA